MIAKGNVKIGIEWRFGSNWPGERCGAKTRKGTDCQRPANWPALISGGHLPNSLRVNTGWFTIWPLLFLAGLMLPQAGHANAALGSGCDQSWRCWRMANICAAPSLTLLVFPMSAGWSAHWLQIIGRWCVRWRPVWTIKTMIWPLSLPRRRIKSADLAR